MRIKTQKDDAYSGRISVSTETGIEVIKGRRIAPGKFCFSTRRDLTQEWLISHFQEGDVLGQDITIIKTRPRQLNLGIQCMVALSNKFCHQRHKGVKGKRPSPTAETTNFAIDLQGRIVIGPVAFPEEAERIAQEVVHRE